MRGHVNRFFLALCLPALLALIFASSAGAASAGWKLLGVSGPTNLPPFNSEVQRLAVDAEGGTFTLTFDGQTTPALPFNVKPGDLKTALDGLSNVGGAGGSVEVSGGPGDPSAAFPYYVRFGGGTLAGANVSQLTADSAALTGDLDLTTRTASVSTKTIGGTPGAGTIAAIANNVGAANSSGTVTMHVGPLPTGIVTSGTGFGNDWVCPGGAGASEVTCTSTASVKALEDAAPLVVPVAIGANASAQSSVSMTVSDTAGNEDSFLLPLTVSLAQAKPGVESAWAGAFDADGDPITAAGGHPAAAAAAVRVNTRLNPNGGLKPSGDLHNLVAALPPGFVGNPTLTPRCPQSMPTDAPAQTLCGPDSIVGRSGAFVDFQSGLVISSADQPIYNGEPPRGYPAQFAFSVINAKVRMLAELRSDEDYGVTVSLPSITQFSSSFGGYTALEGMPAGAGGKALLSNPTECTSSTISPPLVEISADSWQQMDIYSSQTLEQPPVEDCEALAGKFKPSFSFQPSTNQAASVTAATADLHIPQPGLTDPNDLATPHLKKSVVTLPKGMVLNPAAADGLQACSTAQIGYEGDGFAMPNPMRFDKSTPSCPDASKIGTVEVKTPLLDETLQGTVYLAAQDDNPFKSLLAMYLVIDDPETGTVVKLPGLVESGAGDGQLTVTFDYNPQLPVEDLTLRVRGGGPRSQLATPDICGPYSTHAEWTPWSAPQSGPAAGTDNGFSVTSGPGGSACPATKAQRPFALGFEAGSTNATAGANSPFTVRITRPDGNQELNTISVGTPPGFLAMLKGVPICSDAAVAAAGAAGRTGKEELASPSCPVASQVGTTTIGAGVGSQPLFVKTGKAYLTGPYKGAPLSLTFVVPAVAGPFDLGVQVVRTALRVNPVTAQITAESDPIPQILKGIPLQIREVRVDVDRSAFTLNPTNCEALTVTGQVTGGSGAVANLSSRFQVDGCKNLGFKPKLKLQLHGGTKRGDYQRVVATLTARPGDANIARAAVTFPHSAFLAQEHLDKVCTRVQFAAKACPAGSIYGYAKAITPLLDDPVQGPVYLRSNPEHELPDLVAALRGPDKQPIEVELQGRTDSKNAGIRNTFDIVPDAPVSKFTLQIKGGNHALIVNSRNLCKGKPQKATARFNGQNGKVSNYRTVVANDCKKKGKSSGAARAAR